MAGAATGTTCIALGPRKAWKGCFGGFAQLDASMAIPAVKHRSSGLVVNPAAQPAATTCIAGRVMTQDPGGGAERS
jgi:hypothetical protein